MRISQQMEYEVEAAEILSLTPTLYQRIIQYTDV